MARSPPQALSSLLIPSLDGLYASYDYANNGRPEGKEREQAGADWIGIGVGPEANTRQGNDGQERARAPYKHPEADFEEAICERSIHGWPTFQPHAGGTQPSCGMDAGFRVEPYATSRIRAVKWCRLE